VIAETDTSDIDILDHKIMNPIYCYEISGVLSIPKIQLKITGNRFNITCINRTFTEEQNMKEQFA